MYVDRVRTLTKAYTTERKSNELYETALVNKNKYEQQLSYMGGIIGGSKTLQGIIAQQENSWQDMVLRLLESEIMEYLNYIYPSDGYSIKLNARILRGKVHVESEVRSYFAQEIDGDLADTQGRLFQQIVSFAALVAVMNILRVDTVYVDEAFSGVAKANIPLINSLLKHVKNKNYNVVLIAQDTNIASGIDANILFLSRSVDNKTVVKRQEGLQ